MIQTITGIPYLSPEVTVVTVNLQGGSLAASRTESIKNDPTEHDWD